MTEAGKEEYVLNKVKEIGEVEYAYGIYGSSYDIVAKVIVEKMRRVRVVVSKKIRRIKGVDATEVFTVVGN